MIRFIPVILVALLAFSCNETKDITTVSSVEDFYPVAIGQYRIYDVQEILYKAIGNDTMNYQLRETFFDSIQSQDQVSFLIRRDRRDTPDDLWVADSVWVATFTDTFLSVTENNVPFVKLSFPVREGTEWNGNSLNTRSDITYYYQPVESPLIDTVSTGDHIRLIIEDIPRNFVTHDERSEVYVRGIGLVQKDYITLNFCTADCGQELGEIEGGRVLMQNLIETGNE